MVNIKGTAVADAIEGVKARSGEQTYSSIVGLLQGETRALFERATVLATNWYPLDAFVEFLEMDLRVTAQGDEQALIRRSEIVIERQLRGIYRLFVKLGSTRFLLDRISLIHQTYFQGVDVEVKLPSPGKAIVRYTGFAGKHRLIGLSIIGFYRKALQLSGAKEVQATFTVPIDDDKGYCELLLTWSGK